MMMMKKKKKKKMLSPLCEGYMDVDGRCRQRRTTLIAVETNTFFVLRNSAKFTRRVGYSNSNCEISVAECGG